MTIFLPRLYANFLKEVLKFKFDEMRGAAECFVWDIVSSSTSKLFNEVVWAPALPITSSDLITPGHCSRQMSVEPPGLVVASSGVYFGLYQLVLAATHREQRPAHSDSSQPLPGSVTLGPEPELSERCGAKIGVLGLTSLDRG